MRQDEGADAPAEAGQDVTGEVDVSPEAALERIDSWIDGFISLLPNMAIAAIVLLVFWVLSGFAKTLVADRVQAHDRPSLALALGKLVKALMMIAGIAIALTIVAPSLTIGQLVGSLGIGSVAIGFAFKDILQNWLSGLLLLLRQPFKIGDQIVAAGYEGTVEAIETRATIIRTYDGEHAIVPNSALYTGSVLVKTKTHLSRGEYIVGVSYDADIDQVLDLIEAELGKINGIVADPAPDAFAWELADSSVNIKTRWWTKAQMAEQVRIRGEAVRAIKLALDKAGVDIPFPHVVMNAPPPTAAAAATEDEAAKA